MLSNCQGRGEGRRSSEYSNVQDSSGTTNLETRKLSEEFSDVVLVIADTWISKELRARTSGAANILEFPRAMVKSWAKFDLGG